MFNLFVETMIHFQDSLTDRIITNMDLNKNVHSLVNMAATFLSYRPFMTSTSRQKTKNWNKPTAGRDKVTVVNNFMSVLRVCDID